MHALFRPSTLAAAALVFSAAFLAPAPAEAGRVTIKFAALAPEGSTWMRILEEANDELKKKTNKKVKFKFYAGGVMGDESDVLRKLKVNQVHAAGFTGIGLGEIVGDIRVLEQPMLFRSYDEVDAVIEKITPRLKKSFEEKGYVFLGWAEAGMTHLLTAKKVATKDQLAGIKMWTWEGDPVAAAMYKAFDMVPVPLALPDVLTSLQTGIIEGVYAPPLAALAVQWHTRTKFFSKQPLVYASGGLVIKKKRYDKMDADQKKALHEVMDKYLPKLRAATRKESADAIATLKKSGLEEVSIAPDQMKILEGGAKKARDALRGSLFDAGLAAQVDEILTGVRK